LTPVQSLPLSSQSHTERTANVWVGHPYYDLIDNSTDFQTKMMRVVAAVKKRMQIEDKRGENITKRKFLLKLAPAVRSIFVFFFSSSTET